MKGFTLIEMLVSVAIFSVVMVIALGALLAISVSDRKAESLKVVINNLNFSIDSMSRAIRTGSGWGCTVAGGDCPNGGNYISFVPASGVGKVYYRLDSPLLNPGSAAGSAAATCGQSLPNVGCIERSTDGTTWTAVTSPEVVITDYSGNTPASYAFYMYGSSPGPDTIQPKLALTISGYVNITGGVSTQIACGTSGTQCSVFHLQTAVTQRIYDQ